jgi:hypothetical protein
VLFFSWHCALVSGEKVKILNLEKTDHYTAVERRGFCSEEVQ